MPVIATETQGHRVTQFYSIEYRLIAEGAKIPWYMKNAKCGMDNAPGPIGA